MKARAPARAARSGRRRAHAASDVVRAEWLRRVEAEYRSAVIAHHLTLWLLQIGASPDLIADGLRIVKDELAHAAGSHRALRAAGGTAIPSLGRETLGLRRSEPEPIEADVLRCGVEVFCLGETIAVPLFKELREGCTVPAARRVLERVLRDEVRHRDFGWTLLASLLASPAAASYRTQIERELPVMFARLRALYAPPGAPATIDPADRAWGLMAPARYGQVLDRALARDWIPRFERLGIDARRAWGPAAPGSRG